MIKREPITLVLVTASALAVRLYFASTLYLNPDESHHFLEAVLQRWSTDFHPPLFLWWLWAAAQISEHPAWIRLFSAVCGALTPVALWFWLKRQSSSAIAWPLVLVAAFSPNLVLLTIQARGYSPAILSSILALLFLQLAFEHNSPRFLIFHAIAGSVMILCIFASAWLILGMGVAGLVLLAARRTQHQDLVRPWFAVQLLFAALYAGLLVWIVIPNYARSHGIEFLASSFPKQGENLLQFTASVLFRPLIFTLGSGIGGFLAIPLLLIGLWVWFRRRQWDSIWLGVTYLAALAAAWTHFMPFGRTRHSVLLGIIVLLPLAAGCAWLNERRKTLGLAAAWAIASMSCIWPFPEVLEIRLPNWQRREWIALIDRTLAMSKPGDTIAVDGETVRMLLATWGPDEPRHLHVYPRPSATFESHGRRILILRRFLWQRDPPDVTRRFLETHDNGSPMWLLDAGYETNGAEKLDGAKMVFRNNAGTLGRMD
jgi:hypothetical protein